MILNPTRIMLVKLFLTQKVMLNLNVEQEDLDQHKSSSLDDFSHTDQDW